MKTKSLSIILAVLMMVTLLTPMGAFASNDTVISLGSPVLRTLPLGTLVPVVATAADGAASVKFYDVTNEEILLGEAEDVENAMINVETVNYNRFVVAKSFDENGEIISVSEKLIIKYGTKYVAGSTNYAYDFEGRVTEKYQNSTKSLSFPKATGGSHYITSPGNALILTRDSSDAGDNVLEIASADSVIPENTNNSSLHMKSNNNSVSMGSESIMLKQPSGVLVVEYDFYTNASSETGAVTLFAPCHSTAANSSVWDYSFTFKDGSFFFMNEEVLNVGTDAKWHNMKAILDIDKGYFSYIGDGVVVGAQKISEKITQLSRCGIKLPKSAGVDAWFDNFKIYTLPSTSVSIETPSYDKIPAGSQIKIKSDVPSSAAKINYYDVTAFGSEELVASTTNVSDTSVYIEKASYDKSIAAKAFDASGNFIDGVYTPVTVAKGCEYSYASYVYDFDFEDETVTAPDSGKWVFVGGSGFKTNIGDAGNAIVADDTVSSLIQNNTYGKALHNDSNGTGQVQMNAIAVNISGGIVRFDFDFYTNYLAGNVTVIQANTATATNSSVWTPGLSFNNGNFKFNGKTLNVGTDAKWTHIAYIYDLQSDKITAIVDGKVLDVLNIGADIIKINRIDIHLPANVTGDLWIDNFKVATTSTSYITGLADTQYFIDGEAAEALADGNLTVKTAVVTDGVTVPDALVVATYDGNKLAAVSYNALSFENGETQKAFSIDMGEVNADMTAKVMLWNDNCQPYQISVIPAN